MNEDTDPLSNVLREGVPRSEHWKKGETVTSVRQERIPLGFIDAILRKCLTVNSSNDKILKFCLKQADSLDISSLLAARQMMHGTMVAFTLST